jgi:N-terminal acetyltransferase 2
VYLALSVLDFPFCFLLVRIVGTDRIGMPHHRFTAWSRSFTEPCTGEIEHYIVSNAKKLIPQSVKDRWSDYRKALKEGEKETFGNDNISEHVEMAGWGVEEATARNQAEASKRCIDELPEIWSRH